MATVQIVKVFENEADGIQAEVRLMTDGQYRVALLDIDSGEYLPHSFGFRLLSDALRRAENIAMGSAPDYITAMRGNA